MRAELILDARATLGEGPAWDVTDQALYWVDILAKQVHCFCWGQDQVVQLDEYVGCVAPCRRGGLIVALKDSFWTMDRTGKERTLLARVQEPPTNRFNDGKCDPAGRFLAGTMDMNEAAPSGALYSLAAGRPLRKLLEGITISNGLTWSPDYRMLYYIDTPTRQVRAFDYDLETGDLRRPRVALDVPSELGWPDGMTSDCEGRLWIALWGGGRVVCWNPLTGRREAEVLVPAPHVTSCVFGGERLDRLYITTARVGLEPPALERFPLSGGLFEALTDTEGMPTFAFDG